MTVTTLKGFIRMTLAAEVGGLGADDVWDNHMLIRTEWDVNDDSILFI